MQANTYEKHKSNLHKKRKHGERNMNRQNQGSRIATRSVFCYRVMGNIDLMQITNPKQLKSSIT